MKTPTKAISSQTQTPKPVAVKPAVSAAELLGEFVSDQAIGGGVPLEDWLRNNGGEWAFQYKKSVFPKAENDDLQIHFAAQAAFKCATELACHVLKRGCLDKTYGPLWRQLLKDAKMDVEQFRKENALLSGPESPNASL